MSKRDPFDDDDESVTTQKPVDDEDAKVEKVSTEPDPNDDDAEQPGDSDEQKQARKEKRQERGRLRQAADEARQQAAILHQQLQEERAARVATETTARHIAEFARASQQPQRDPWEVAMENEVTSRRASLRAEHENLVRSERYTPEQQQRMLAEWQKTEIRLQELVNGRANYYRDMQAQQAAPQQETRAREIAAQEQIKIRYPDILANPRATAYMDLTFQRMTKAEGRENNWDTGDLAAAETRRAFRMGTRPAPDAATKARYSGVGGGANGHANGDGSIDMIPKFKRMAEALFPDDKPSVAYKKWAQGPGKRMLANE